MLYQRLQQQQEVRLRKGCCSVRETVSLLYNRIMDNIEYGRERLKDIVEKEAREEEEELQNRQKSTTI